MKKNKKIILVTGVAGMLGSELVSNLVKKKNYIIIGIDNFTLGKKQFIKKFLNNNNFKFFNIDLSKKVKNRKLINLLHKNILDEVWHLAANSDIRSGINNPNVDFKNTFLTTYYTLDLVKKNINKNTKLIFTSSSAVFGYIKKNIDENTPAMYPCSNYGSFKLASEGIISSFCYLNNIQSFIFRLPNVVGKNLTHGVVFDLSNKIKNKKNSFLQVLGNGDQCKPYSFSTEILKSMLFVIKRKHIKFINYYNLGTNDKGVTVKKIVSLLKKKYKYEKKISYQNNSSGWKGDIPKYKYSTKKINRLGYKFSLNSLDAINLTISYL
tara:strand:+ start:436 stop:1404 length:969 start_codon:yes stop_codon:yes gene_type:complete